MCRFTYGPLHNILYTMLFFLNSDPLPQGQPEEEEEEEDTMFFKS